MRLNRGREDAAEIRIGRKTPYTSSVMTGLSESPGVGAPGLTLGPDLEGSKHQTQ